MYKDHTVGVVVPAYNEEGFVGRVIETLPPFVDRAYVIDDCSTDGTWAEIQSAAERVNSAGTDDRDRTADAAEEHPERSPGTDYRSDGGTLSADYRDVPNEAADDAGAFDTRSTRSNTSGTAASAARSRPAISTPSGTNSTSWP